ncbi:MAG: hypothetical protein ABI382_01840 [Nakamurella sp.]
MSPSPLPLASQSLDPQSFGPQSHDPLESVEHSLAALDGVPLEEQAAVFEEIHRDVTQVLASTVQQVESTQTPGTR